MHSCLRGATARTILILALVSIGTLLAAPRARSESLGVSPYLPLKLSPEIERQIERVLILGDKPVMKRPIAAATVLDALPKACKRDERLCQQVRHYLARYMSTREATHASAEVSLAHDSTAAVPNSRGLSEDSIWDASIAGHWQLSDHLLLNLGANGNDDRIDPTGSYLSTGFDFAQLDVGYRDHWFSPFTDSSMLISTQAPNIPSVTLSNYRPLTRLGFQYELFLAEMSTSDNIAFQGRTTSGHPRLAGMHLSIEPVPGWSLAANRLLQYGGGERDDSLNGLFNAFVNPSKYDNFNPTPTTEQFGNQLGGFTAQFIFPGKTPFSVYADYSGEDSFHAQNLRVSDNSLSFGVHFPRLWRKFEFTYEFSAWQNAWYVSGVYGDGLTNNGHVLGHWGGDWRVFRDAVGASSHMVQLGWEPSFGGALELRYRTFANEQYTNKGYERAHELTLSYAKPWRQYTLGAQADAGRDVFGEDFGRLSAFIRYSENAPTFAVKGAGFESDDGESGTERFVDVGYSQFERSLDTSESASFPVRVTSSSVHLGLGARRAISRRNDIGMRLEYDRVEDAPLIALRVLDYRFRLTQKFALTAFAGAARYTIRTPAHGYYGGLGAQWRNLFPGWDLSFEGRYGDKLVRSKVFAGEFAPPPPPPGDQGYPNLFYDISGASAYLSYRF